VVQLVDQAGALADGGLRAGGDLAEGAQGGAGQRGRCGPLADGEVGGGAGLDGIGLLAAEQGGAVVLVALRIAAGQGEVGVGEGAGLRCGAAAEALEEVQEVVGVLSGGIDADGEGDGGVASGDGLEALAEQGIADARLGEGEFGGGGLEIVAEEGGIMAVAEGVDADADANGRGGRLRVGVGVW
jgi:hypothetical protein